MHASLNAVGITNTTRLLLFYDFNLIYFLQMEQVSGIDCVTLRSSCINCPVIYTYICVIELIWC